MDRIDIVFELDMHYIGQTHTVSVPLPVTIETGTTGVTRDVVQAAFDKSYQASFSRLLPGLAAKIVNLRTSAIGRRPQFNLKTLAPGDDCSLDKARIGTRPVWFDGGWHDTMIYARLDLPVGAEISGPAILEQPDATVLVDPDLKARVDELGNIIMERK
jgi:N-methylhydantoinase A